jgi:hypothetical protein
MGAASVSRAWREAGCGRDGARADELAVFYWSVPPGFGRKEASRWRPPERTGNI